MRGGGKNWLIPRAPLLQHLCLPRDRPRLAGSGRLGAQGFEKPLGEGGGLGGGVNNLNSIPVPVPVPVPVPLVHHHFPIPLFLIPPPPRAGLYPPPARGSSPSPSSPSSPSSFSSSPSSLFSAYPRSLRLTPQMGVQRVEVEEALVVVQGLEELLEQLPLPVAAPLAPSQRVRGWKKKVNFCAPK